MAESMNATWEESFCWQSTESFLPLAYRWVLYKTEFYQAAGYVGRNGQWYSCAGTPELLPVQGWRELS